MVTGLDLVALQLRVARGEPLGLVQKDVTLDGHAIEVRLYAEDPEAGFLPSSGPVHLFRTPAGEGIRVDAGLATGGEVSSFYDPMIAKIIAHGTTRDEARRRLVTALGSTAVFGPRTNRDFLIDALTQRTFASGKATTAFIGDTYGHAFSLQSDDESVYAAAAVLQHASTLCRAALAAVDVSPTLFDWTSAGQLETIVEYEIAGGVKKLLVRPKGGRTYSVSVGDKSIEVTIQTLDATAARLLVDARTLDVSYRDNGQTIWLAADTRTLELRNLATSFRSKAGAAGQGLLLAPMHGRLADICVAEGDSVKKGDRLAVLEAMKMQHELTAEIDGRIVRIGAVKGAQIAARDLILEIAPLAATSAAAQAGATS
jgi:geranyl-CoA carboxylase alpha subunit